LTKRNFIIRLYPYFHYTLYAILFVQRWPYIYSIRDLSMFIIQSGVDLSMSYHPNWYKLILCSTVLEAPGFERLKDPKQSIA